MLDTSAFRNALGQLEEMYNFSQEPKTMSNPMHTLVVRTAMIKGYEFTYEMATKTMKRFVEELTLQNETAPEMSFREILRSAFEYGLIHDIVPWVEYRKKRNETSHTYAEEKAIDVVSIVPSFLEDAKFLLEAIEKRLKDNP